MPCVNTRIFFSKTGRAKYISHLDLSRCFQRAIRRAKLPVWETEGFNPRIYLAFMLPMSLGQEGECEAADMRLTENMPFDTVKQRLNSVLPPDIRIIRVDTPKAKAADIAQAEYKIECNADIDKIREFISAEHIQAEKKTKKGTAVIDLKPLISDYSDDGGVITLRLPAGNTLSINPALLLEAFSAAYGVEISCPKIVRTKIFCADGSEFC